MISQKIILTGRVQGVGFRYFVKMKADKLNLAGWVRNTFEGPVEMIVTGDLDVIQEFTQLLLTGNGISRVEEIKILPLEYQRFQEFNIISTK